MTYVSQITQIQIYDESCPDTPMKAAQIDLFDEYCVEVTLEKHLTDEREWLMLSEQIYEAILSMKLEKG